MNSPTSSLPADWLAARTAAAPNALALVIGEQRWTYAGLSLLVDGMVAQLHGRVQPRQIVALLMPNTLAHVCLIHALARLDAILLPLNTRLTPAELGWQLADAGCQLLIVDESFRETGVQAIGATDGQLALVTAQLDLIVLHAADTAAIQPLPDAPAQLQALVYTSGTTGRPKAAMLTFDNHFYSAMASAYRLGVQPDDLWLSCLPLYHVGGLAVIWRSCLYGTAVSLHQRFILDAVNRDLDTSPITLISVVPTMLQRLLATRQSWPSSLRLILLGGAAATPELVAAANALPRTPHPSDAPLVATTYGLTEAASQVATMVPSTVARKPGSVGRPLLFTAVDIVDDDGRGLPPNTPGEIVVSGPTVMAGYFNRPDATAVALRGGALHTGDIGYLDDEGDLWLVDRRSDIIVTGGENVYPAEVEAVLRGCAGVTAVCVVGVADAEWGQRVVAMVVASDETVTADTLTRCAREQLAGYKVPRQFTFVDALPLTASGKIARGEVRALMGGEERGGARS